MKPYRSNLFVWPTWIIASACVVEGGAEVQGNAEADVEGDIGQLAWGQCPPTQHKLGGSDRAAYDRFGSRVAVSGTVAVAGAPDHDHHGTDAGAAYVYRFNGAQWAQEQELSGSDIYNFARFGTTVAASGTFIVVGTPGDFENGSFAGAAYVFRYDGTSWVEDGKLVPSDGAGFNEVGTAIAISGNVIVLGVELDDTLGDSAGAAYVFRRVGSTWIEEDKLLASDGITYDKFGIAVGISGNTVVIGAYGDDDHGSFSGSAYAFSFDGTTWIEEDKLVPTDGSASDFFAGAIAVSGNKAVIGSAGDDDRGNNAGAAYVFRDLGSSWVQEVKLVASDGVALDAFGSAVALDGNAALVGASGVDGNGNGAGAAYVFAFATSTWVEAGEIQPTDGQASDSFGGSVGLSGVHAMAGSWSDDDGGINAGSAYLFTDACTAPPIAPNPPTSVTASDGAFADKVRVTWSAPAGGGSVTGYKVFRSTTNVACASLLATDTASPYDDTTAVAGTTYYYSMKSTGPGGDSACGVVNAGYRALAEGAPNPPTSVAASDGTYTDKVRVTWAAPSSGSTVTSYKVYRATTNAACTTLLATDTASPYDDATAIAGTTYYYSMKSTGPGGDSACSAINTGYRAAGGIGAPHPPWNVIASNGTFFDKVRISWAVPIAGGTVAGYKIYRSTLNIGCATLLATDTASPYDDTTAIPGTNYYYSMRSSGPGGDSATCSNINLGFVAAPP